MSNTKISALPDNLIIGANLMADFSELKALPKNLVIGGSLFLRYSSVEEIPDDPRTVPEKENCVILGFCTWGGRKVSPLLSPL